MFGVEGTESESWVKKLTDTESMFEPSKTPTWPSVQSSSVPIGGLTADELINPASPDFNAAHPGRGTIIEVCQMSLLLRSKKHIMK